MASSEPASPACGSASLWVGVDLSDGPSMSASRFVATGAAREMGIGQLTMAWYAHLRSLGVFLVHPDDGWVDRAANTVKFVYPVSLALPGDIVLGPFPGVRVALGWADRFRLVKLTRMVPQVIGEPRWAFVEVA